MRRSSQNFRLWFKGWSKQQRQEDLDGLLASVVLTILYSSIFLICCYTLCLKGVCVCVCVRLAWMIHLILGLYEDTWIPDISKWSKMWDKKICLYSFVVFSCIYHSSSPLLFSHSSSPHRSSIQKKEKMRFYNLMICNNHKACRWVAWIEILTLLEAG